MSGDIAAHARTGDFYKHGHGCSRRFLVIFPCMAWPEKTYLMPTDMQKFPDKKRLFLLTFWFYFGT